MAQQATTYRINRLAKDFNVKSKEILDILKDYGFEGKTHMAILEPNEFNLFMELFTSENQISNIDEYVKGEAVIPRRQPRKSVDMDKEAKPAAAAEIVNKDAVKAENTSETVSKRESQNIADVTPRVAPDTKPDAAPKAANDATPETAAPVTAPEKAQNQTPKPAHDNANIQKNNDGKPAQGQPVKSGDVKPQERTTERTTERPAQQQRPAQTQNRESNQGQRQGL